MKRAIFVDRDGTIIIEPVIDEQVDSLEKLEFIPGAISGLAALRRLDYDLVMATNQDGLGTPCFPTENFEIPHQKMLKTLEGEGVTWDDQLIDGHFPSDNSPMRKPGIGMFGKYLDGSYDLSKSYVIGDRLSDMQLAANLGAKGILLENPRLGAKRVQESNLKDTVLLVTDNWTEVADFIRIGARRANIHRVTRETDIDISIDLDNRGDSDWHIDTGLKFLDHMLDQISHHGNVSLNINAIGDLHVDEHHTIEDVGITLGQAVAKALGNKEGIGRYGFALPMDDCRALVLVDFGGRIDLEWDVEWSREYVGDVPTEMMRHFFQSFCAGAQCNMYVQARGENEHHKAESIFKALARALRMAFARTPFSYDIPSSKGLL